MSRLYTRLRACAALLLVGAALPAQAATLLVTTSADELNTDGDCSLREAVQAANTNVGVDACGNGSTGGDTILFTAITGQTVTLTAGQIEVTDGLTIGDAVSTVTIVASVGARHFRLSLTSPVEPVQLTNVTLRGGSGIIGGSVLVADGQPSTFRTVTFDQNTSAASGGALRVGAGTHTLAGCVFTANTTSVAGVTDGGGAVYNNGGTLDVRSSSFSNNTAIAGTANGGAVLNGFGGTLNVSIGTTFTSNQAARAGGAIESAGNLTVDGGSFTGNMAGINGGAVHLTGAVTAAFTGSTGFVNNAAGMEGGAVWNSATGTLTMANPQITGNSAAGPAADQGGGGVFSDGGTTTLTNPNIDGNRATGAAGSGGGVLNTAGGRLTVTGGSITSNTAVRAGGGVETNLSGGATGNTLALNNVTISLNNAGTAPGFGGGVHVTGAAVATVTGGTVSGNTAVEGG
ncbi:MAG TPA: CSLREA domain-containing protein, partial [Rubricoccaceae bacterium]